MDWEKYRNLRENYRREVLNLLGEGELRHLKVVFDKAWLKGKAFYTTPVNESFLRQSKTYETVMNVFTELSIIQVNGRGDYDFNQVYIPLIIEKLGYEL